MSHCPSYQLKWEAGGRTSRPHVHALPGGPKVVGNYSIGAEAKRRTEKANVLTLPLV